MDRHWAKLSADGRRGLGAKLDRLTRYRYLTRMQQVRLEVLKGMGCIININ